jgi:hypothetical protein
MGKKAGKISNSERKFLKEHRDKYVSETIHNMRTYRQEFAVKYDENIRLALKIL